MSANCSSCPFYSHMARQCRADPPVFQVVPAPNGQMAAIGVWPPTKPGNWCGRHPDRKTGIRMTEEETKEEAAVIHLQSSGVQ